MPTVRRGLEPLSSTKNGTIVIKLCFWDLWKGEYVQQRVLLKKIKLNVLKKSQYL